MFCQAITSRGSPCIASRKPDSTYCRRHDGRRVECPVCLEEVPHIRRLPCGHDVCVECLYSLTTDACPMCRRAGIRRFGALRDAAARLYPPDRVPAFVDDVEHARLALLDLASVLFTLRGPCMFSSPETRRTQYVDAMRTLVDFACRFHVIAFRDPQFLDSVFDAESGLPYTDPDPCMRRFIRSLDSFRQRVGGLPAFDRTRASSEWLAHLGPHGHID